MDATTSSLRRFLITSGASRMVKFNLQGEIGMRGNRVRLFLVCVLIFLLTSMGLAFIRKLLPSSDLFTQINIASVLCGATIFLMLILRRKLCYENVLLMIVISLVFFISHQMVLLNIDRSRSYYVIGWVHAGNVEVLNDLYTYDKVVSLEKKNEEASNMRINEQINRGVMVKVGGNLKLTLSGKAMFQTAEILSKIFTLENWKENYR